MKILPFKIPKPLNDSIIYQIDFDDAFYNKLHQHEELQLSLIIEGKGTLIVGDTVNYYKPGDVIILGSNLPHVFKSDLNTSKKSHMITLFFHKNGFGKQFFELEELKELQPFFKKSAQGFKVTTSKKRINTLFLDLENASKLTRFIILLEILKLASKASYKNLSSFIYEKAYSDNEGKRMQDVFDFTITHFDGDITLESIAEVANMSKNAFCKYFKKRTNKTYFRFLNELRVEHACKLLIEEKDMAIAEIAFKSGFKNISNFNRQFKIIKKINPGEYRNINTSI